MTGHDDTAPRALTPPPAGAEWTGRTALAWIDYARDLVMEVRGGNLSHPFDFYRPRVEYRDTADVYGPADDRECGYAAEEYDLRTGGTWHRVAIMASAIGRPHVRAQIGQGSRAIEINLDGDTTRDRELIAGAFRLADLYTEGTA